jgi:hypothetical protein
MFAGFGTLSGGAHLAGQRGDRFAFQLVSDEDFSYRPRQCRATLDAFGRKQSDAKLVDAAEKAENK